MEHVANMACTKCRVDGLPVVEPLLRAGRAAARVGSRRARFAGLLVGLAATLTAAPAVAQQAAPPGGNGLPPDRRTMTAVRLAANEQIALDGVLDEAAWQRAVPASDFTQQDPVLGGTPTERTEVRILFDGERLYMGVTCFDSEPDLLLGNTMKRDAFLSADDRFMWTLDTFLDQQTGYYFEMNPSGLMADSLMGTGSNDRAWDGIWNARVRKGDIGWTIEIIVLVVALIVVLQILIGPENMWVLAPVVTNLIDLFNQLGGAGVVGLIALAAVIWAFGRRPAS